MDKPRVLIDCERLKQRHTGLGQVALNLGTQIQALSSHRWQPVFLLPASDAPIFGKRADIEVVGWRRRYLPNWSPQYDLWHVLHQDAALLPGKRTPYVLTIHDLNFLQEKSSDKAKKRLAKVQRLVDGARVITVISNFTKSVVEAHLDINETPIEGCDLMQSNIL